MAWYDKVIKKEIEKDAAAAGYTQSGDTWTKARDDGGQDVLSWNGGAWQGSSVGAAPVYSHRGSLQNPDNSWIAGTWNVGAGGSMQFTPDAPAPPPPTQGALSAPGVGERQWDVYSGSGAFDFGNNWSNRFAPAATLAVEDTQGKTGVGYDWASQMFGAPSYAADAYNRYQAEGRADLALDPNLGGYYDNAKKNTGASIGDAFAARGLSGSTAELNQMARSYGDLDAERANREADYALRRAGEMRLGGMAGAELGAAADRSRLGFQSGAVSALLGTGGLDLEGTGMQMDFLGQADKTNLEQVQTGMTSATGAGAEKIERIRGEGEDLMNAYDQLSSLTNDAFKGLFESDEAYFAAIEAVGPAVAKAAQEGDAAARQEILAAAGVAVDAYGTFSKKNATPKKPGEE